MNQTSTPFRPYNHEYLPEVFAFVELPAGMLDGS
jgi:hypothetical protein